MFLFLLNRTLCSNDFHHISYITEFFQYSNKYKTTQIFERMYSFSEMNFLWKNEGFIVSNHTFFLTHFLLHLYRFFLIKPTFGLPVYKKYLECNFKKKPTNILKFSYPKPWRFFLILKFVFILQTSIRDKKNETI